MMRALSVTQPWGGTMAAGLKPIENRGRPLIKPSDFGKPFALHATREIDEPTYDRIAEIAPELATRVTENGAFRCWSFDVTAPWYKLTRITSAVIAVATVDHVIIATEQDADGRWIYRPEDLERIGPARRWLFQRVGYVRRDVIALATPVPTRGWQHFFTLPDDVERAVRDQLARRRRCGAAGVDEDGNCKRCGLVPSGPELDEDAFECPSAYLLPAELESERVAA